MTVLPATRDVDSAWRFFDASVAAATRLSPSFVRLTLTGPNLDEVADNGWDQRFKLVLPDARGGYDSLPRHPDWHAAWRTQPEGRRNPIRTYTVRAVRPSQRELDVDIVLHGEGGPASRFASRARPGDPVVVLAPNSRHPGPHGGLEWRPPAGHDGPTLLVADPTAVPAVLSILAGLPGTAYGEALLEVPAAEDIADVPLPPGFRVTWLVRPETGSVLSTEVAAAAGRLGLGVADTAGGRVDRPAGRAVDEAGDETGDELLWDVPVDVRTDRLYAWLAGESGVIADLRRHLVRDLGVDRRSVAFMGYWRRGRPGG